MTAPETIRTDFGRAVREIREEAGISQEDLALHAGLARSYYTALEGGKKNIGLETVAKVAQALGVPVSVIFERAEQGGKRR